MIIVFKPTATVEDKSRLKAQLEARGVYDTLEIPQKSVQKSLS